MRKFISLLILFCALSCSKTEHSYFPSYPVYLELDLTFEDKDLNGVMAYKEYILGKTSGLGKTERTGFGGVLVYHDMFGYSAYDLACPYETQMNVRVKMDEDGIHVVCPKCGSKYNVYEASGNRVEGPATRGLKPYQTALSGTKLYVTN